MPVIPGLAITIEALVLLARFTNASLAALLGDANAHSYGRRDVV